MKKISILIAILIAVFCSGHVYAESLSPFGDLEWSDNINVVIEKLNENKSIKQMDITNLESPERISVLGKSKTEVKKILTEMIQYHLTRSAPIETEVILENGKKSLYLNAYGRLRLDITPIVLAGIPYKMSITFNNDQGICLIDSNKPLLISTGKKNIILFSIIREIKLTFLDSELLSQNYKNLLSIIQKKYHGNCSETYFDSVCEVNEGDYRFLFKISSSDSRIYYTNSGETRKKEYEHHRGKILSKELSGQDSSSAL